MPGRSSDALMTAAGQAACPPSSRSSKRTVGSCWVRSKSIMPKFTSVEKAWRTRMTGRPAGQVLIDGVLGKGRADELIEVVAAALRPGEAVQFATVGVARQQDHPCHAGRHHGVENGVALVGEGSPRIRALNLAVVPARTGDQHLEWCSAGLETREQPVALGGAQHGLARNIWVLIGVAIVPYVQEEEVHAAL